MVPVPEICVHIPEPVTGIIPASTVEEVLHKFWSNPAFETVGLLTAVIVTED